MFSVVAPKPAFAAIVAENAPQIRSCPYPVQLGVPKHSNTRFSSGFSPRQTSGPNSRGRPQIRSPLARCRRHAGLKTNSAGGQKHRSVDQPDSIHQVAGGHASVPPTHQADFRSMVFLVASGRPQRPAAGASAGANARICGGICIISSGSTVKHSCIPGTGILSVDGLRSAVMCTKATAEPYIWPAERVPCASSSGSCIVFSAFFSGLYQACRWFCTSPQRMTTAPC